MSTSVSIKPPIRYDPSLEQLDDDENETIEDMIKALRHISETTWEDGGHALRSVHAKSHGLLEATLTVNAGLAPELAQGLFATPGDYRVLVRLSTSPGDILPDSISTPRAMALKVLGVGGGTQDFVLVNGPAFSAKNAKAFQKNLKLLSSTTDKSPGLKQVLSTVLQAAEKAVEAVGGKSPTLVSLGGHPETNLLGETFYSQVPLRYGDYVAKISVAPVSLSLTALTGAPVDLDERPNGLRAAVVDFFGSQSAEWEIRAQLYRDPDTMPIEDASKVWPEDESPYITVGRIVATPQVAWSEARAAVIDDGVSFSPWHCIDAHRPLGGIMRARKKPYEMSMQFRAARNGGTISEPAADFVMP